MVRSPGEMTRTDHWRTGCRLLGCCERPQGSLAERRSDGHVVARKGRQGARGETGATHSEGATLRKKLITFGIASLIAVPAFAGTAFAGNGDGGYGTQPGFGQSTSQTPCAGHGAFGVYSHGAIPEQYPDPHMRAA